MAASPEQEDWIRRVLGVDPNAAATAASSDLGASKETVAALSSKAAKAGGARPDGPPKSAATSRLLGAIANGKAPDDAMAVPDHLATLVPGFLATIETERPVTSKPLIPGDKLSGQDQILGLADLYAAVQRSVIAWEQLLDEAEQTNEDVDKLEAAEDRDETIYGKTLATYNRLRADSLEAEARALPLIESLQAKLNSLSADQQQAALKEAANA